jgi:hypothetical protein
MASESVSMNLNLNSTMNECINNDNEISSHNNNNNENAVDHNTVNNSSKEECVELRNMKYKSMLLKKTNTKQLTKCNSNVDIDSFLEKERTQNKEEQWAKLDKSMKIIKINAFVEHYSGENNLNEKDKLFLHDFLLYCLEQKKLIKTKDVLYDKINGTITSIPCLLYTPTLTKKFTLKRCEKRPSTLSSLAPKSKVNRKPLKTKSPKSPPKSSKSPTTNSSEGESKDIVCQQA